MLSCEERAASYEAHLRATVHCIASAIDQVLQRQRNVEFLQDTDTTNFKFEAYVTCMFELRVTQPSGAMKPILEHPFLQYTGHLVIPKMTRIYL